MSHVSARPTFRVTPDGQVEHEGTTAFHEPERAVFTYENIRSAIPPSFWSQRATLDVFDLRPGDQVVMTEDERMRHVVVVVHRR